MHAFTLIFLTALALCVGLILGATYLPGISTVMGLEHPGGAGWRIVVPFSLLPLVAGREAHDGGVGLGHRLQHL